MSLLALALALFVMALIVFAIDLLIPSGGVLIAVTGLLALASIVVAFRYSTMTGIWMVIATFLAIPLMFWAFIEIWPRTPMGKRLIVEPKPADSFVWSDAAKTSDPNALLGATGIAISEMLPSGQVRIGEQTFEAFSESGPIEIGMRVKVIRLDVGRLVVLAVRGSETDHPMSHGSGLDRPANELNIESLDG